MRTSPGVQVRLARWVSQPDLSAFDAGFRSKRPALQRAGPREELGYIRLTFLRRAKFRQSNVRVCANPVRQIQLLF